MLAELSVLAASPAVYAVVVALGLLWGSFANVCIYRWPPTAQHPRGRSVVRPGSHCFACGAPIRWYDNVPLAAWLWLRGRCRACGARFSARYLLVEALTGALFAAAWWAATAEVPADLRALAHGAPRAEAFDVQLLRFAIYAAFALVMVVIAFIDLDHKLILNKVTVPSIAALYALGLALPERTWSAGLVGIAVGYGVPWAIGEIYYRATGRDGLGLGDGMLLAVVGALLGWPGVVGALFGGSVVGSVIGVAALGVARRRAGASSAPAGPAPAGAEPVAEPAAAPSLLRTELPFGPFLASAALAYLLAEPWIQLHFRWPGG